jgi:hypothetical protein
LIQNIVATVSDETWNEAVVSSTPRLLSDDMVGPQQAAIRGPGIATLPGYICRATETMF